METVKVIINGKEYDVPKGSTILEAARSVGISIPTLCYLKGINAIGACRICVVEVKGARSLVASCVYPVTEGMEITTNSVKIQKSRKMTLELILSNHKRECLTCSRNQNCELQQLAIDYNIDRIRYGKEDDHNKYAVEDSAAHLVRDNNKCILCRRCVAVCSANQGVSVIGPVGRGFKTRITCSFEKNLADVPCINCGQCIVACPTGALTEKDDTQKVWDAINNPDLHVVVGSAPSVRVQIGEAFGFPIGTNVEGKLAAALKRLGFDGVYDVDTAADLTIMEEGTEFLKRLKEGGKLPLITSCSPGWIKYCEHFYPEFIDNLSSCRSPQGMFGAMMKSYYAEKTGIDPKKIFVVSIMPCTAKKFEIGRDGQDVNGMPALDAALTTRELAKMIKRAGIVFKELPDETFEAPFGIASGAGHIFGATGGVMEAALRTVAEIVEGKPRNDIDFKEVRGVEGIKRVTYNVGGTDVKVAVVSGTANAARLLDAIKAGKEDYHFIEIMACPGGCVNGGGQIIHPATETNFIDVQALRAGGLYKEDAEMPLRKSHENPVVKEIYDTYLGEPGSHKAHKLLHTQYTKRDRF